MSVKFPEIRIGDPIRYEGLGVFPLFGEASRTAEYVLSDEAMGLGAVAVEEISAAGSVPTLAVDNKGDVRVLFIEGEQLVGAKQNRILNASILVAARSRCKIPVTCVEAGRWHSVSPQFGHSGMHSPTKLRSVLKGSVSASLRAKRGHRSDQGGVWDEVARKQAALGAFSPTEAMSDLYAAYSRPVADFWEKLKYVDGAVGAAVAIGGRVVSVDVFDKAATFRKVWNRMLGGVILDRLELKDPGKPADGAAVEKALSDLAGLTWQPAETVGEGQEFRAESASKDHASALVLEGTVVHGSMVYAA